MDFYAPNRPFNHYPHITIIFTSGAFTLRYNDLTDGNVPDGAVRCFAYSFFWGEILKQLVVGV